MNRTAEDICLICQVKKADKTGSHLLPAAMIEPCVGERNKEESYVLDFDTASIDTYFGRSSSKNNKQGYITDHKQHHYSYDYLFCSECERRLGNLESTILPVLLNDLSTNSNNYISNFNSKGAEYWTLLNCDPTAFNVFWYSIVFRFHLFIEINKQFSVLSTYELKYLRESINAFLYDSVLPIPAEGRDYFRFNIATKEEFKSDDSGQIFFEERKERPIQLFVCQYILYWYTGDINNSITEMFAEIFNSIPNKPVVFVFPEVIWNSVMDSILSNGKTYLSKVGQEMKALNGKPISENILEFKELIRALKEDPSLHNPMHSAKDILIKTYSNLKK